MKGKGAGGGRFSNQILQCGVLAGVRMWSFSRNVPRVGTQLRSIAAPGAQRPPLPGRTFLWVQCGAGGSDTASFGVFPSGAIPTSDKKIGNVFAR